MALRQNIVFLFIIFITFILIGQVKADESSIDITTIKYTNDFENGEAVTIVQSGKNESTEYSFKIFDDDNDFPDNWEETSFDDSEWTEMTKFENETFVEENDELKKKSAGAGLTDND